jgi:hypothetical protein
MKKTMLAALALAISASPAFAAGNKAKGDRADRTAASAAMSEKNGKAAFARVNKTRKAKNRTRSSSRVYAYRSSTYAAPYGNWVIVGDHKVARDPDRRIRFELVRQQDPAERAF